MYVKEFVQIYNALRGKPYAADFLNAEITSDHDQIFFHLENPRIFSSEDLRFLDSLDIRSHASEDELINTFVIYL